MKFSGKFVWGEAETGLDLSMPPGQDLKARGHVVRLSPKDNVVTALRELRPGELVKVGPDLPDVTALEVIPFGHKMAIVTLQAGSDVVKYGDCIGLASQPIAAGAHVHIHNVNSRRAQV